MPFRGIEEYLHDIVENIDAARGFVRGRTVEQFKKNRPTHDAVLRALEIVSYWRACVLTVILPLRTAPEAPCSGRDDGQS
jgi:hypothetical protein